MRAAGKRVVAGHVAVFDRIVTVCFQLLQDRAYCGGAALEHQVDSEAESARRRARRREARRSPLRSAAAVWLFRLLYERRGSARNRRPGCGVW